MGNSFINEKYLSYLIGEATPDCIVLRADETTDKIILEGIGQIVYMSYLGDHEMGTRIEKCQGRLTVYFEDPFWVGVFERIKNGKLSAAKVTFGAEPKDYEVQEFITKYYYHLKFSPAIKTDVKDVKKNPKRAQRDAKKQTLENGIGTKSQQALKLQQEKNKLVRKERSKMEREAESDRLFELKQQKKKEKHKGH